MYSDWVHKTKKGEIFDNKEPENEIQDDLKEKATNDVIIHEKAGMTWCSKLRSFICCRGPNIDDL